MKKIILLFLFASIVLPSQVFAQSDPKIDKTIDQLKNKVASKVAELNLVQKRGLIGTVVSTSGNQITLTDLNGNNKIVDVDELTEYSSDDDKNFGLSDVKKGMQLSILGLYNKDSEKLLARFVDDATLPIIYQGVVSGKDDKNFTLMLSTEDGTTYLVDIEDVTKAYGYDSGKLATLGFTKMPLSVNAIVVGFPDKKEKNRITAGRIILFPGVPKNPKVPIIELTPTPEPTK
jgi:hypothetical protein